jgi:hypothetical protein
MGYVASRKEMGNAYNPASENLKDRDRFGYISVNVRMIE